jgi:RNA recognition motif-containing protein
MSSSRSKSGGKSSSRSRRRSRSHEKTNQIFVTRFHPRTRSRDLEDVFRDYGRIRDINMKRNFAFITFSSYDDASRAVRKMNRRNFQGSPLVVQHAGDRRREHVSDNREKRRGP